MFNLAGEVIGVNTAIFSPSGGSVGIGFATPSSMAKNIIAQLRATGEVRRGWLGVRIQNVTDALAEGLRLDRARGARSEEHKSELQSLMRTSYAVFCLKTKTTIHTQQDRLHNQ